MLPDDLVREIDKYAGAGRRSKFLEEAARERIKRTKLDKALSNAAGILKDDLRFSTSAKVRKYIRDFRKENSFRY